MKSLRDQHGFTLIEVMAVMAVIAIAAAMALPSTESTLRGYRLSNDGRAIADVIGMAKMRAASRFTRTRVYVDRAARSYRLEIWNKGTAAWEADEGVRQLSAGVTFGFGSLTAAPTDTQDSIGFSAPCTNANSLTAGAISGTACVVFNSRGVPVNGAGDPIGDNGLYITDGIGVYAATVTATPLVRTWWSPVHSAAWIRK